MEKDIKKICYQMNEMGKALNEVIHHSTGINNRISVQDKKIDVIINKMDLLVELLSRLNYLDIHAKTASSSTKAELELSNITLSINKAKSANDTEIVNERNVETKPKICKFVQNVSFCENNPDFNHDFQEVSSAGKSSSSFCHSEKVGDEGTMKLTSSKSSPAISSQRFSQKGLSKDEFLRNPVKATEASNGDIKSESLCDTSLEQPRCAKPSNCDLLDESQTKNANSIIRKNVDDSVRNKSLQTQAIPNAVDKAVCNVIITNEEDELTVGAEQDKKCANVTANLENKSGLHVSTEQNRRSSYAGMTVKQKEALSSGDMIPTNSNDERQRSNSTCDLGHETSTTQTNVKRAFEIKRQLSNSSNTSAHSGVDITMGADSDSDDDDTEIKLPDLPTPGFAHRIVSVKNTTYKHFYDLKDPIGGGRFGRVYHCVEKKSGMQLAAKCFQCKKPIPKSLLKSKSLKRAQNLKTKRTQQEPVEKEDVMIEIAIMNQIDHQNIVKLYDAYENDNSMTLILEYLGGGELFERVLADRQQLTELDAVLFMKQIVTAVQYLHKNHILHLDLKPENILCLDRSTHLLKIIDFGLARKFNPRQKLIVQWGTPEFMAPEMLNYDVVSFPSDMWSIGIICYILLSGISPFLGEDDNETMANIVDCDWDFDEPPFKTVSEDAKDFISRLLVEEKSGRMSAAQCLRHDWLAAPLTGKRRKTLMNKSDLKHFMARMQWKASIAAVSAANWLKTKVNNVTENVRTLDTPV